MRMLMGSLSSTNITRKNLLFLVGVEIGIFLLLLFVPISIPCIFKEIFSFPCPGCGMTRAFYAFFKGQFIDAFTYNILFYPFLFFLLALPVRLLFVFIEKEGKISFSFLQNPIIIKILFLLLFGSEVYNIIRGI